MATQSLVNEHKGSGEVSQLALTPEEIRRGLRLSIIEGMVATITISITGAIGGSVFLTGFALLLGANNFHLGVMGALPFMGQLFQFIGAYLEERVGKRRPLVLYAAFVGRMMWAFLLALPFLSLPAPWTLTIFFIGLGFSYGFNGIAGNAWLSWMSDLVPPHERGRYFGLRNTLAGVSAMVSTYGAGFLLDYFRAQGMDREGYAVIFSFAVVATIIAAIIISFQPEPPHTPQQRIRVVALFTTPLRNPSYRSFAIIAAGWALVTGIAAPFFNAYGINGLHLDFATLALTAIVTSVVSLISQPFIGQLQDRFGDKLVLVICMICVVPLPWGWVLSTPTDIRPLWLTSIFAGVFWPGIAQGLVNVLMARSPAEGRGAAIATYGAITGLGTLVSGLVGGAVAAALTGVTMSLGPVGLVNLTLLFVLSSVGRLWVALWMWRKL